MNWKQRAFEKITSGQFVLTVLAGILFLVLSIQGKLEPNFVGQIILMVFILYFRRDRDHKTTDPEN